MKYDLPWLRDTGAKPARFGLLANAGQVAVAVVLMLLVGGSLQLSKLSVLDSAGRQFSQTSYASKVSFLVPFAIAKSVANLAVGFLADRLGRKWMEVIGWVVGLFVPLIVMTAPSTPGGWARVVGANAFLGAQQGLAWSACLFIFIDVLGPHRRGLASGLNEFVGYTAVALFAYVYGYFERTSVTCSWTDEEALRAPECVELGGACAVPDDWHAACVGSCACGGYTGDVFKAVLALMLAGLGVSIFLLKETLASHVAAEEASCSDASSDRSSGAYGEVDSAEAVESAEAAPLRHLDVDMSGRGGGAGAWAEGGMWGQFVWTSFRNPSTAIMCWAGFVTNFMTGLAWGLILAWARDGLGESGVERNFVASCYSLLKGIVQLGGGMLSDRAGRMWLVVGGMVTCAGGLAACAFGAGFSGRFLGDVAPPEQLHVLQFGYLVLGGSLVGIGTGLMYPVLTAAVGDHSTPATRGGAVGTFRFWRDLGYAAGAPVAALADVSGPEGGVLAVAATAAVTGLLVLRVYKEARPTGGRGGGQWKTNPLHGG